MWIKKYKMLRKNKLVWKYNKKILGLKGNNWKVKKNSMPILRKFRKILLPKLWTLGKKIQKLVWN